MTSNARIASAVLALALGWGFCPVPAQADPNPSPAHAAGAMEQGVHAFTVKTIDGKDKNLADYAGRILLVVNVASKCGFTPQYKGLEALYQKHKDKGFMILGFPSNDFFHQEPGTDAQIKSFCSLNYDVTFDLFSKIDVKGTSQAPLYRYLTAEAGFNGPISWNFNKFLVGRDGRVLARWGSMTKPESAGIEAAVEKALADK